MRCVHTFTSIKMNSNHRDINDRVQFWKKNMMYDTKKKHHKLAFRYIVENHFENNSEFLPPDGVIFKVIFNHYLRC